MLLNGVLANRLGWTSRADPGPSLGVVFLLALCGLLVLSWSSSARGANNYPHSESPIIVMESNSGFEQTIQQIKNAAVGNNFRVIREQSLDFGFVNPQDEDADRTIIYFCDFGFLHDALMLDKRIGAFLPCQVTVVREGNKVLVMSMNPKVVSKTFFHNPKLDRACDQLRATYVAILEEGTL